MCLDVVLIYVLYVIHDILNIFLRFLIIVGIRRIALKSRRERKQNFAFSFNIIHLYKLIIMGCINSKTLFRRNKSNSSIVSNPVVESNNDYSSSEINLLQDYDPEVSLSYLTQNLDDSVHYGDNYDSYTSKNNGSNSPTTNGKNENKSVKSLDLAASLIQKQARRKAAKLRAEAEKRWLVFSNLDTVAEADMIKVSSKAFRVYIQCIIYV